MTISELINLLQQYPAEMRVVVNGYEEGYDDLSPQQISTRKIMLNTGKDSWQGKHGEPSLEEEESGDVAIDEALVLHRVSH